MPGKDMTCASSQDKLGSFDRTKLPPKFHSKTKAKGVCTTEMSELLTADWGKLLWITMRPEWSILHGPGH